jgi:photosystem II stability/assembly factor-like uncharacterized protein
MPWATLANNQTISRNNLQNAVNTGVFTLKAAIPVSNECVTKTEANGYVNIDTSYPPFASKTSNQLVVKEDLKSYEVTLSITNSFFIGTITNVTVNGFSVTGGSFPIDAGSGTIAYSDQAGICNILVYYADATNPSNYMRITDSEYNDSCIDGFSSLGPGPYYVTFSNQILNTSVTVAIISGDGQCLAPPPTLIADLPFSTVAVSRGTGQYMLAGNANIGNPFIEGALFRSTNYGVTWTLQGQFGYWNKVAISDNGQYMLAVEWYGRAYKSSDYGATWDPINNFPNPSIYCPPPSLQTLNFRGAALSADGQFQVISTGPTKYEGCGSTLSTIFVSNNYGVTWTAKETHADDGVSFNAVAISASGQTVLAVTGAIAGNFFFGQGDVIRSNNYGANWFNTVNSFNAGSLVDVSITADGAYAIAARFSNDFNNLPYLLSSYDGGVSWYTAGGPEGQKQWKRVAIMKFAGIPEAWALPNTNDAPTNLYRVEIYLNYVVLWEDQPAPTAKFYKSIAASENPNAINDCILIGANNGLYVSNDAGFTWTAIQSTG